MIARKIDSVGRIVIPKSVRDQMGIKDGDILKMEFDGKALKMEKYETPEIFNEKLQAAMDTLENLGYKVVRESGEGDEKEKIIRIS